MEDLAYLIKYDSVHGKASFPISYGPDFLMLGSHRVTIVNNRGPGPDPVEEA